jgi:hypothetical protein
MRRVSIGKKNMKNEFYDVIIIGGGAAGRPAKTGEPRLGFFEGIPRRTLK